MHLLKIERNKVNTGLLINLYNVNYFSLKKFIGITNVNIYEKFVKKSNLQFQYYIILISTHGT